jgi:hypothetical protein
VLGLQVLNVEILKDEDKEAGLLASLLAIIQRQTGTIKWQKPCDDKRNNLQ